MFKRLNHELKLKKTWIIIGYSFNDPIIREIFIKNSDKSKQIVFLHPEAQRIVNDKLNDLDNKNLFVLTEKFGLPNRYVNTSERLVNLLD